MRALLARARAAWKVLRGDVTIDGLYSHVMIAMAQHSARLKEQLDEERRRRSQAEEELARVRGSRTAYRD